MIDIEITGREAELLLKYGYPFEECAAKLQALVGKPGCNIVQIDAGFLQMLVGDLCYSAKRIRNRYILEELDALCDVIETAIQRQERARKT